MSLKNVLMLVTDTPDAGNCIQVWLNDAGNSKMMLVTTKRCW